MRRHVSILIVDDSEGVRDGVSALLQANGGFQIVGMADNGQAGVQMAVELAPDVVLMDYNMPGMNGAEATRALCAACDGIAVVGFSSDDWPEIRQSMEAAGACGFFVKGDNPRVLIEMLHDLARRPVGCRHTSESPQPAVQCQMRRQPMPLSAVAGSLLEKKSTATRTTR